MSDFPMSYPFSWSENLHSLYAQSAQQFSSNIENIPPPPLLKKMQMISNPKKISPQLKPTKTANHSIRAGDWVCLLCNNLNFSFRNECNRCQKQTKKQNYIQNLIMLNEEPQPKQFIQTSKTQRKPLGDLTNLYSQMQIDHDLEKTRETYVEKSQSYEKSQNYGFENVLLLTPPKSFAADMKLKKQCSNNAFNFTNSFQFNSPSSETNKQIIKPYSSPQQIPSISPILSNLKRGNSKGEELCARNLNEFLYEKIYEDSHEDELCYSLEYTREEPLENLFSKLMEDDSFSKKNNNTNNMNLSVAKESEQNNLLNSLIGFMHNPSYLSLNNNSLKELKGKKKNKNKGAAATPENERKSDWYCLNCTNLNYSFRIVCNRCQSIKNPMTE